MKNSSKKIAKLGSIIVVLTVAATLSAQYNYVKQAASPLATLSEVPAVELPAAAARFVANARPESRPAAAREVLQTVASIAKPGVLPFVVSSICRSTPEVAATVATSVFQLETADPAVCLRAAMVAAPENINQIVFAVCQQYPASYAFIATLAADQAGTQARGILEAVAGAVPDLKPFIQRALAQRAGTALNVAATLAQVADMAAVSALEQSQAAQRKAVESVIASQDHMAVLSSLDQAAHTRAVLAAAKAPDLAAQTRTRLAQAEKMVVVAASASGSASPLMASVPPAGYRLSAPFQSAPRVIPPYTARIPTNTITTTNTTVITPGTGNDYSAP